MLDTIGLLQLSPTRALIEILGVRNGVDLSDDTLEILDITAMTGRVTQVTLQVRKNRDMFTSLPLKGSVVFTYNRLDLAEYFSQTQLTIKLALPTTTRTVMEVLTNYYGYQFDSADFVVERIDENNAHQYQLKATPRSLRWVGSLTLDLLDREELGALAVVTTLPSLVVPAEGIKPVLQHHKQITDGLRCGGVLLNYVAGEIPDLDQLAGFLTRLYYNAGVGVTPTWVNSITPAAHNVSGIEILYNGEADAVGIKPYITANHRVVILRLSDTLCTDVVGQLVLYYNARLETLLPEEPDYFRMSAELIKPQAIGFLQANEILGHNVDSVFTDINENLNYLDEIYDRVGLSAEERWKCTPTPSPWNIYGAKVEFLGFNVAYPPAHNYRFSQVWVVLLDDQYCTNLTGRLIVYFNYSRL